LASVISFVVLMETYTIIYCAFPSLIALGQT
jgi:hypothetical protein